MELGLDTRLLDPFRMATPHIKEDFTHYLFGVLRCLIYSQEHLFALSRSEGYANFNRKFRNIVHRSQSPAMTFCSASSKETRREAQKKTEAHLFHFVV